MTAQHRTIKLRVKNRDEKGCFKEYSFPEADFPVQKIIDIIRKDFECDPDSKITLKYKIDVLSPIKLISDYKIDENSMLLANIEKNEEKEEKIKTEFKVEWKQMGTVCTFIYKDIQFKDEYKIAGFDLDHNLIRPKGNHVFSKGIGDWKICFKNTEKKLKEAHENGFTLVIFTNQLTSNDSPFKENVSSFLRYMDLPFIGMASKNRDIYRKPLTGMFDILQKKILNNGQINREESFYVGDAAGRPKDHSISDIGFARNLNLTFKTPENFFLDDINEPKPHFPFSPMEFCDKYIPNDQEFEASTTQEMIIFVGYPASGKSRFFKTHLKQKGYVQISKDLMKAKSDAICQKTLEDGFSVAVDNTNPSKATRKVYIDMAKKKDIPVRCIYFENSFAEAMHKNIVRSILNKKDRIPRIAYNKFRSSFELPDVNEGLSEILKMRPKLEFESEDEEKLFKSYLVEHL